MKTILRLLLDKWVRFSFTLSPLIANAVGQNSAIIRGREL